ncbi:MAG: tRNA pseudouridine(13) synthase TruD [Thioalkalispiraceae bacterium]
MPDPFNISFPRAYADPVGQGQIKLSPEDFKVVEKLSFPLSGAGEHLYLQLRKTGQNTLWVVEQLARHFELKKRDIGYAGLKDRHAITTQWFSLLQRPGTKEKLNNFSCEGVELLDVQLSSRKLRKGAIQHNDFTITVRNLDTAEANLTTRLDIITSAGVPNYFDEQRFGRQRQNLLAADKLFHGRLRAKQSKRRLYISAARSWLFNLVLAERIRRACWSTGLNGDVFNLNGSKKYFHQVTMDHELQQRLVEFDIHPTAPLWGEGELLTTGAARELELSALSDWSDWCHQLERARLKQQRRPCRVLPENLHYQYDKKLQQLNLSFRLPAGAYATNVLREIIDIL